MLRVQSVPRMPKKLLVAAGAYFPIGFSQTWSLLKCNNCQIDGMCNSIARKHSNSARQKNNDLLNRLPIDSNRFYINLPIASDYVECATHDCVSVVGLHLAQHIDGMPVT